MVKVYPITIKQTIVWYLPITAKNKKEAFEKAKWYFNNIKDDYTGVSNEHIENPTFKISELEDFNRPEFDNEIVEYVEKCFSDEEHLIIKGTDMPYKKE